MRRRAFTIIELLIVAVALAAVGWYLLASRKDHKRPAPPQAVSAMPSGPTHDADHHQLAAASDSPAGHEPEPLRPVDQTLTVAAPPSSALFLAQRQVAEAIALLADYERRLRHVAEQRRVNVEEQRNQLRQDGLDSPDGLVDRPDLRLRARTLIQTNESLKHLLARQEQCRSHRQHLVQYATRLRIAIEDEDVLRPEELARVQATVSFIGRWLENKDPIENTRITLEFDELLGDALNLEKEQ